MKLYVKNLWALTTEYDGVINILGFGWVTQIDEQIVWITILGFAFEFYKRIEK